MLADGASPRNLTRSTLVMHRCRYCSGDFPSERQRRTHACPNRQLAHRAELLRWPTEPVEAWITDRFGTYDRLTNPEGYCANAVERLTGTKASTWADACRGRGLTDTQADRIACALGGIHEALWPGWLDALDPTDDDIDWLDAWRRGAVVA